MRVLKPGGTIVMITPNKYDYVSVVAAVTPYSWHRAIVSRLFGVPADDVFPTRYRANTLRSLRAAMSASGLVERHLDTITHYPAYLMFSPMLFRIGVVYERLTRWPAFRNLRASIVGVFQKPAGAAQSTVKARAPQETGVPNCLSVP